MATRRAAYHHGDLRNALVRSAIGLLERGDAAAITLREVARRAGVSQAAPYHHFEDKSALLAAVAEEGFRLLDGALEDAAAEAARRTPARRLEAMFRAYVRFAVGHGAHYRAMFVPELKDAARFPTLKAAAEASLARVVGEIAAARGAPPEAALAPAVAFWAWGHGLASLAIDGLLEGKAGLDVERLVERVAADAARAAVG